MIYLQASPGVDCGIGLLSLGERFGFPVGEPLSFAYSVAEKNSEYLLQACIRYGVSADHFLQFYESLGVEFCEFVKIMEIILQGEAYFGHALALEKLQQLRYETESANAEKECFFGRGYLHQRHLVILTLTETGAGFCVEAHIFLL